MKLASQLAQEILDTIAANRDAPVWFRMCSEIDSDHENFPDDFIIAGKSVIFIPGTKEVDGKEFPAPEYDRIVVEVVCIDD